MSSFAFTQRMPNFAPTFMSRSYTIAPSSMSKNILVVITTILLLFVSCSPTIRMLLFSPEISHTEPQDASSQKDSEQEKDLVKASTVYEAVIPIYKFQIAFCCSFVRSFSFIEKKITNEIFSIPIPQSHYFRTLFRLIIPSNAP